MKFFVFDLKQERTKIYDFEKELIVRVVVLKSLLTIIILPVLVMSTSYADDSLLETNIAWKELQAELLSSDFQKVFDQALLAPTIKEEAVELALNELKFYFSRWRKGTFEYYLVTGPNSSSNIVRKNLQYTAFSSDKNTYLKLSFTPYSNTKGQLGLPELVLEFSVFADSEREGKDVIKILKDALAYNNPFVKSHETSEAVNNQKELSRIRKAITDSVVNKQSIQQVYGSSAKYLMQLTVRLNLEGFSDSTFLREVINGGFIALSNASSSCRTQLELNLEKSE
ncbi:MAG: hypothetical protein KDD40_10280 [Bdellovibrionales bacterium]|nr:hypothetical protein [Bdellovibrionales bacterium]